MSNQPLHLINFCSTQHFVCRKLMIQVEHSIFNYILSGRFRRIKLKPPQLSLIHAEWPVRHRQTSNVQFKASLSQDTPSRLRNSHVTNQKAQCCVKSTDLRSTRKIKLFIINRRKRAAYPGTRTRYFNLLQREKILSVCIISSRIIINGNIASDLHIRRLVHI